MKYKDVIHCVSSASSTQRNKQERPSVAIGDLQGHHVIRECPSVSIGHLQ
jgi:hypothetical protein